MVIASAARGSRRKACWRVVIESTIQSVGAISITVARLWIFAFSGFFVTNQAVGRAGVGVGRAIWRGLTGTVGTIAAIGTITGLAGTLGLTVTIYTNATIVGATGDYRAAIRIAGVTLCVGGTVAQ